MKKVLISLVVLLLLTPLALWSLWHLKPVTPLRISILDKTVVTPDCPEHASFNWVLTKEKYSKPSGELYQTDQDYYGFFPKQNKQYELKGLEKLSETAITKLAAESDVAYVTDTYGVYNNEWFSDDNRTGVLYGGLSRQDLTFLTALKQQRKLILTEFNSLSSPTTKENRLKFEKLFGLRWTGWVGRYFTNLDTLTNQELPPWLIPAYKRQHGNKWPFTKSGIVLVREDDHIEVLEDETHLKAAIPAIKTFPEYQEKYALPDQVKYPFWFDIMMTSRSNKVISTYTLRTNARGDSILNKYNILKTFPAVIEHQSPDYQFYYFAGDFADNKVNHTSARFRGIGFLGSLFSFSNNSDDRSNFFWDFYSPLITNILATHQASKNSK